MKAPNKFEANIVPFGENDDYFYTISAGEVIGNLEDFLTLVSEELANFAQDNSPYAIIIDTRTETPIFRVTLSHNLDYVLEVLNA